MFIGRLFKYILPFTFLTSTLSEPSAFLFNVEAAGVWLAEALGATCLTPFSSAAFWK